ncbi:MAG: TraX family protein [Ancrocorticia sp.]
MLLSFSLVSSHAAGTIGLVDGTLPADVDMTQLTTAVLAELASWIAVPIYAWLLVQGYQHTRHAALYLGRLLALALICEVPYDLVTSGNAVDWNSQNPVFALVITLFALMLINAFRDKAALVRRSITLLVVVAGALWMLLGSIYSREGIPVGMLLLLSAVILQLFSRHENVMVMSVAGISSLFLVLPAFGAAVLHYRNGTLGYNQPWVQWVFYALYPVALLVFVFI